ncbi:MAG: zf-HC2 domain-containing protein [Candidatus Aminicenantes bacterium]|nr:zf-HC2 domain-containing protein [Candidatus Aminicenantes bacterium]
MMECLNNEKIQEYINGELTTVENAMVRDHLIICKKCRFEYEYYERLEKYLEDPVYIKPPEVIERNVLKALFPRIPALSSVLALIAASFTLIITWIYIYFDFANNSIIQALQITSSKTSNFIASVIKIISTIFSAVYAIFKIINAFIDAVFKVNIGVEIIGLLTFMMFISFFYLISRIIFKKIKGANA